MAAARREFGEGNHFGVHAFGVDRKVRHGRATRTRALNVYVVHKHRPVKDTKGAFNCGVFIGMYVPLIDLD
jgi:hypothetical protein